MDGKSLLGHKFWPVSLITDAVSSRKYVKQESVGNCLCGSLEILLCTFLL